MNATGQTRRVINHLDTEVNLLVLASFQSLYRGREYLGRKL
jgi:hypothetical protein